MVILWLLIGIVKVVDHLFHPNSIGRWKLTILKKPAHIAVRCCVHINRESGQWIFLCWTKSVFIDEIVFFCIECRLKLYWSRLRIMILLYLLSDEVVALPRAFSSRAIPCAVTITSLKATSIFMTTLISFRMSVGSTSTVVILVNEKPGWHFYPLALVWHIFLRIRMHSNWCALDCHDYAG